MELYRWNINDNMDASWPDVLYQKENAVYAIPNGRVVEIGPMHGDAIDLSTSTDHAALQVIH